MATHRGIAENEYFDKLPYLEVSAFIVPMALLEELLSWVRTLPGSQRLRALVVFDEVYGFLQPHPAHQAPIVALMKQARAFGVGVVVATQNPMDLDYRARSAAGRPEGLRRRDKRARRGRGMRFERAIRLSGMVRKQSCGTDSLVTLGFGENPNPLGACDLRLTARSTRSEFLGSAQSAPLLSPPPTAGRPAIAAIASMGALCKARSRGRDAFVRLERPGCGEADD